MILCPDDHPERWTNPSEAFAHVARTLRDEVLPGPTKHVYVMVGPPGSGKSRWASSVHGPAHEGLAVILDACHAHAGRRRALAKRIRAACKRAVAVWMQTPLAECQARNARRDLPRRVPAQVIAEQHRAIARNPPTRLEGWDEIIKVDHDGERAA